MNTAKNAMNVKKLSETVEGQDRQSVESSGIDFSEKTRSASFLQEDSSILFSQTLHEDVDILSREEAVKQFPEVKDYVGSNFKLLGRDYPKDSTGGYFIRVKKGKTVNLPVQACLFLKKNNFKQQVHNIIIIEEGARVYLITGCTASKAANESIHIGISEFFVKKGGYLNFTMIHSWKEDISVKPMSIALVEEGATFISNYICLKPVKDITMYPTAILNGPKARASFNSLILSFPSSLHDIGSRVILKCKNTQAEISREQ